MENNRLLIKTSARKELEAIGDKSDRQRVAGVALADRAEERFMKTRLVRIGNSRGIRLPKPVIEQAGLPEEVELRVRQGSITIMARARPRSRWAEAARRLRASGADRLLDGLTPTRFDEEE